MGLDRGAAGGEGGARASQEAPASRANAEAFLGESGALARFASFFTSPLFTESSTMREVNAVMHPPNPLLPTRPPDRFPNCFPHCSYFHESSRRLTNNTSALTQPPLSNFTPARIWSLSPPLSLPTRLLFFYFSRILQVDSEHRKNLQQDSWRIGQLFKATSSQISSPTPALSNNSLFSSLHTSYPLLKKLHPERT